MKAGDTYGVKDKKAVSHSSHKLEEEQYNG
jgi:hypothetical protein